MRCTLAVSRGSTPAAYSRSSRIGDAARADACAADCAAATALAAAAAAWLAASLAELPGAPGLVLTPSNELPLALAEIFPTAVFVVSDRSRLIVVFAEFMRSRDSVESAVVSTLVRVVVFADDGCVAAALLASAPTLVRTLRDVRCEASLCWLLMRDVSCDSSVGVFPILCRLDVELPLNCADTSMRESASSVEYGVVNS